MKYEMIFGDAGLFFDAQKDCEMVGNGHHKVENGKLMVWNFSEKYWSESHTDKITIQAMRRIIKEPKRWTLEDKKAGVSPEVGSIFTYRDETLTCHFIDGDGEIWAHDIDNKIVTPLLRDCQPIETPAEKAKREEDEFIRSLAGTIIHYGTGTVKELFTQGARAAYRKLKGGE